MIYIPAIVRNSSFMFLKSWQKHLSGVKKLVADLSEDEHENNGLI